MHCILSLLQALLMSLLNRLHIRLSGCQAFKHKLQSLRSQPIQRAGRYMGVDLPQSS